MARNTSPIAKKCKALDISPAVLGYSNKKTTRNPGGDRRKKVSEYGSQMKEKQKVKFVYGVLERQFRNYFEKAERQKGITGENLLVLLERRLDNLVYRMGLASRRTQARQLVMHGHFEVGGRRVDIPSYLVRSGEVIKVCEKSKESPLIQGIGQELAHKTIPVWLSVAVNDMSGTLVRYPSREEMDVSIQEHLIVELYSR